MTLGQETPAGGVEKIGIFCGFFLRGWGRWGAKVRGFAVFFLVMLVAGCYVPRSDWQAAAPLWSSCSSGTR